VVIVDVMDVMLGRNRAAIELPYLTMQSLNSPAIIALVSRVVVVPNGSIGRTRIADEINSIEGN
jgi:hypothetical protein